MLRSSGFCGNCFHLEIATRRRNGWSQRLRTVEAGRGGQNLPRTLLRPARCGQGTLHQALSSSRVGSALDAGAFSQRSEDVGPLQSDRWENSKIDTWWLEMVPLLLHVINTHPQMSWRPREGKHLNRLWFQYDSFRVLLWHNHKQIWDCDIYLNFTSSLLDGMDFQWRKFFLNFFSGLKTPTVYYADYHTNRLCLEYFPDCIPVKDFIRERLLGKEDDASLTRLVELIGQNVARLHDNDMIHGDLTTSNLILTAPHNALDLYLIDFGLGYVSHSTEDKSVDLYVLERAFLSTHPNTEPLFARLLKSYFASCSCDGKEIMAKFQEVRLRGRKRVMIGWICPDCARSIWPFLLGKFFTFLSVFLLLLSCV